MIMFMFIDLTILLYTSSVNEISVMTIHTDLAARHIQQLAESGKGMNQNQPMPYILAGDWNIKPDR